MDEKVEMQPTNSGSESLKFSSSGITRQTIIIAAVIVSAGLAIGLGVGLGVGLNNVTEVYVTTTKSAASTTSTPKSEVTTSESIIVDETTASTDSTPPPGNGPWIGYRLSGEITPSHYKLTIQPNLTTDINIGTNEMTIHVWNTSEVNYIILHAHAQLEIDSVELQWMNGTDLVDWNITRSFRYPENEFFIIEPENPLPQGETFILTMGFTHSLVITNVGIYKATYVDPEDGQEKGIVGSDMEPTDARRGYPCFDEPTFKVRYTTTIIHEQRHTALSNMPVDTTEDIGNGLNKTLFETSVPMSTYLACFVVSEFQYKEKFSEGRNIPLRIYATKYQIENGQIDYALNVTAAIFHKYEELFGVDYPLPKYDQLAIPNFATGAVENWGLVCYRESNLLWDPTVSSTYYKQRVAAVVSHEFVHQWFGNIVTMKWWDNLWLNEGFASYLGYYGEKWAEPDWIMEGHHVVDNSHPAMRADSATSSHPMVANVFLASQIGWVFDTITYFKGSAVLKMLNVMLGEDIFFGGLQQYLQDFRFKNADDQDLWNSMQEYINSNTSLIFDVTEIMDPWVQQSGYPLVTIDTSVPESASVSQEVMLSDPSASLSDLDASIYDYTWSFELSYFTDNNLTVNSVWFNRTDDSVVLNLTEFDSWVKLNQYERGFYRVNYQQDVWEALSSQLINNVNYIEEIDRAHLLDDALNLAPAKKITYVTALDMTKYLNKEESFFVWDVFSGRMAYIRNMFSRTEYYANYKAYYLSRVKPIADSLGWDVSLGTHEDKRNRPNVLGQALLLGDEEAYANASNLFQSWKADSDSTVLHQDIRQLVYRYGVLNGDTSDWEFTLQKYMESNNDMERTDLLEGVAATEDVLLIARLLDYSKNTSIIRDSDFFSCITYISYSVNGNDIAWSWVRINWDYLVERFTLESSSLGNLVPNIVQYYNTEIQRWEVESFFDETKDKSVSESARTNSLNQINDNIAWMAENEAPIAAWLQERVTEI